MEYAVSERKSTSNWRRVKVRQLLNSRYTKSALPQDPYQGSESYFIPPNRPSSWEDRIPGIDTIVTEEGETLEIYSDPQQSTPKIGWTLLIGRHDEGNFYRWTLYGIS
jgi:hypothetical protein